ncbi:uncharacterized protein E0L32_003143 [Thyridium curvatum]|uniref:Uncharacterized protein n=1 Tax=Thyridium curvatum TaxID=1093900 RepID=A0A507BLE1_9PEZI|nr:uncharacterized protein E0L32_003143 [Thyridium curvatum]TPX17500.1 hypothetical protein E0L32_003143 [Thyridium curvatum]
MPGHPTWNLPNWDLREREDNGNRQLRACQTPGPLGPTRTGSPVSSDVEWDEDIDMDFESGNDDTAAEDINGDSTEDLVHDQAQSEPSSWNMARFLLNQERDRFCLWRFGFSESELDQLVKGSDGGGTQTNVFGIAMLQSVVHIGKALHDQTRIAQGADENSCYHGLDLEIKKAQQLIQGACGNVSSCLSSTPDVSERGSTTYSFAVTIGDDDEPKDLYSIIKSNIVTLQELNASLLNTLNDMTPEVRKQSEPHADSCVSDIE